MHKGKGSRSPALIAVSGLNAELSCGDRTKPLSRDTDCELWFLQFGNLRIFVHTKGYTPGFVIEKEQVLGSKPWFSQEQQC